MTYVMSTYWRSGAQSIALTGEAAHPKTESEPPQTALLKGRGVKDREGRTQIEEQINERDRR
jgi:hypothetical protein